MEKTIDSSVSYQGNGKTNVVANKHNNVASNNFFVVLNEVMRIIIFFDVVVLFFILSGLFTSSYDELLFSVHRYTVIVCCVISAFKGLVVDGSWLNMLHHIITNTFFYYATGFCVSKFMFSMVNYLIMRSFKRFVDDGYFTKQQWMKFYASYSYFQLLVVIYSVVLDRAGYKLIDAVGYYALFDNFMTCRKHDLSNQIVNVDYMSIPLDWLKSGFTRMLMSVLDIFSLYTLVVFMNYNVFTTQSLYEMVITLGNYKGLLVLLFVNICIKPLLKKLDMPVIREYAKSDSIPSIHMILAVIISSQLHGHLFRLLFMFLVGFYRIFSRTNTMDDVGAGIAMGSVIDVLWCVVFD